MITGSSDANYFYSIFGVKGAKGVDGMRYTPSTDTAVLSMGSCTYTFSGSSGLSSNCAISAGKRANPIAFADMTNAVYTARSEEHTSELQSLRHLVCRLLLEK